MAKKKGNGIIDFVKGTGLFQNVSASSATKPPSDGSRKADEAQKLVPVTIKTHADKNGGHPHVIVDDIEDKHVSVGLSTKPTKGKGSKNYRLERSPLNDGKTSYMRRQGTVAPKSEYKKARKGKMTSKDYERAKVYGERAKQKHLREKKDKKK